jgi:hypothetical protein
MSATFLKIKICSLAAEATIIRKHERRAKPRWQRNGDDTFFRLKSHRTIDVRNEQRAALLAYGYLRGRPYRAIEANCTEWPNWTRVAELVRKYGPELLSKERALQAVQDWRDVDAVKLVMSAA